MTIALKIDTTTGQLRRFAVSDVLEIDAIERRSGSGNLLVGGNLGVGEELKLGSVDALVRVLGDLEVDGSEVVSTSETVVGQFTAQGNVQLGVGNDGDQVNLGSGANDVITLNADLRLGTPAGGIDIGTGVTEYLGKIWLEKILGGDAGPNNDAYNLNTSGVDAGAYAIGVDPARVTNSTAGNLMDMLADLDAAVAVGSPNLQSAYTAGNTIAVTTAEGEIQFTNSTDSTDVQQILRAPASGTGGRGLYISMGANCTGRGLQVTNEGSGDAFAVFDGAVQVFTIGGNGSLTANMAAASQLKTTAGNLLLSSDAAELTLNDVGGSNIELNQSADRVLDETGVGEVLEGATSIIGAINRLARSSTAGAGSIDEAPIQDGVTIAAGDVVAQSTVTGRVTTATMNNNTNSRVVGIALTGGTGDAGGTVTSRFALPGTRVTISGASYTAGNALFAPETPGPPVNSGSAPGDAGDVLQRVGWARSTTDFIIDLGPQVIL